METFKKNLQEFAQKHRKDIRKDPTFRAHFQKMCANIGVDPLACIVNNIHKQCPPPLSLSFFCHKKKRKRKERWRREDRKKNLN